jgi:hypothetical protein
VEVVKGHNTESKEEKDEGFGIQLPEIPELRVDIPKEEDSADSVGPKLYVRDDGSVDWEGALQDREALKKFGGAVWARINGQIPDELGDEEDSEKAEQKQGFAHEKPAVTAKIEETPAIRKAREELNRLEEALKNTQASHTALLSSGTSIFVRNSNNLVNI